MSKLKSLILKAQEFDTAAMTELIEKFKPIIKKYSKQLNHNPDLRSELMLGFIELIHNIDTNRFSPGITDGIIINYISVSMRHLYIKISQNEHKYNSFIIHDPQYIDDLSITDSISHENTLIYDLKNILTEREFFCVYNIVISGYTAKELSNSLGISKQAVNQCKKRALTKLKNHLFRL